MGYPKGLTIWEAQYGDFNNLAQVIIDQYISSASEKWGMMNGLVLFLPHGYEGQGSEHSSARIERFLTLCANNNMNAVIPTTPANLFHLLRRQAIWKIRVPLIVFTPKSLLRHPLSVSPIEKLTLQGFSKIIEDETSIKGKATKLIFTSGKIYYDLYERCQKTKKRDISLIRVEQLYPFPINEFRGIISKNSMAQRILWVQDEPENMGVWPYISRKYRDLNLELISRNESASPAAGLPEKHKRSMERILNAALG
jgi:2-oxoglutarate dehydrogenase E1 component